MEEENVMSLVKREDFTGTVAQSVVMEVLESIGIVNILNHRQYVITINGVQKSLDNEYLEDSPNCHVIDITKIIYIGNSTELSFVHGKKINTMAKDYLESMNTLDEGNVKFGIKPGIKVENRKFISVDANGDCWYNHDVQFPLEQGPMDFEKYIELMFKTIVDIVMNRQER